MSLRGKERRVFSKATFFISHTREMQEGEVQNIVKLRRFFFFQPVVHLYFFLFFFSIMRKSKYIFLFFPPSYNPKPKR